MQNIYTKYSMQSVCINKSIVIYYCIRFNIWIKWESYYVVVCYYAVVVVLVVQLVINKWNRDKEKPVSLHNVQMKLVQIKCK